MSSSLNSRTHKARTSVVPSPVPRGQAALGFSYALLPLAFKTLALALLWRWRHSLEIRS